MVGTDRRAVRLFGAPGGRALPTLAPIRHPFELFVPARRSFFDEGLHAFKRCFVHHVARHDLTRRVVRVRDTQLDLAVEKFFSHCDCDTWFADDRRDKLLELGVELFGFCDTVDQPRAFASCALMNSPVTSISNACLRKTFRESATPGVEQKRPTFTPLTANRAALDATARSHIATN